MALLNIFFLKFYSWFLETAQVLSTYILVHLIVNTIFMANSVFQLDLVVFYEFGKVFIEAIEIELFSFYIDIQKWTEFKHLCTRDGHLPGSK